MSDQRCINVIQMFCVCWDVSVFINSLVVVGMLWEPSEGGGGGWGVQRIYILEVVMCS